MTHSQSLSHDTGSCSREVKERHRVSMRKYMQSHPEQREKQKVRTKSWAERNRDHVRSYNSEYSKRPEARAKSVGRYKRWYAVNKVALLFARKLGVGIAEARELLQAMESKNGRSRL